MSKKVVTARQLEKLMLAELTKHLGCESASRLGFYRVLHGAQQWRVSGWGGEAREVVVRQVESEMSLRYYLADE
jgi:hypothetical protein